MKNGPQCDDSNLEESHEIARFCGDPGKPIDYLEGVLSDGLAKEYEEHLKTCKNCRKRFELLAAVWREDLPPLQLSEDEMEARLKSMKCEFLKALKESKHQRSESHPSSGLSEEGLRQVSDNAEKRAMQALADGNVKMAEQLLHSLLKFKRDIYGEDVFELCSTFINLFMVYQSQHSEEASSYSKLAARAGEDLFELSIIRAIMNLGDHHVEKERLRSAERSFEFALSQAEELGSDEELVKPLNSLASVCRSLGKHEEAESHLKRSLKLQEELLGPEDEVFATTMGELGTLYTDMGMYKKAENHLGLALSIGQEVLGEEHPAVADAMDDLAELYIGRGLLVEADRMFRQSLGIRKNLFGVNHLAIAQSLSNIARVSLRLDRLKPATQEFGWALGITKEILGDGHPVFGELLNGLGIVLTRRGKLDEAETVYKQSL